MSSHDVVQFIHNLPPILFTKENEQTGIRKACKSGGGARGTNHGSGSNKSNLSEDVRSND